MKRNLLLTVLVLACLGAGLSLTAGGGGPEAGKSAKSEQAKKPAVDPKAHAELLKTLENLVSEKDPAKLGATAKRLGDELLASLEYQRGIAKLGQQEILLEHARSETMSAAQEANKERKALKVRLEKDIEELKRIYAADPKQAEAEMVARIQAFRPTLLTLKHQEEEFTKVVKDTSDKLSRVRNEKHRLEREYDLVKLGVLQRKAIFIPPISPGSLEGSDEPPPAPPPTNESLKKALESLKDL